MDGDAGGRVAASTGARSPPDPADSAAAAAAAETTGDDPRTPLPVAGADSPPAAATFDDDTIRSRRRVTLPLFSVRLSKKSKKYRRILPYNCMSYEYILYVHSCFFERFSLDTVMKVALKSFCF